MGERTDRFGRFFNGGRVEWGLDETWSPWLDFKILLMTTLAVGEYFAQAE